MKGGRYAPFLPMTNINDIFQRVREKTDSIILFHSATGDSILLTDFCFKWFKTVQLVYMYFVPCLQHVNNYIQHTENKYNTKFIQVPHYALGSYIKRGFMGMKKDENQRLFTLSDIVEMTKTQVNIQWAMMGFKQADGLNRRLMLRGYDLNAINWNNQKVYPLSEWKNSQVLQYIDNLNLIKPLSIDNNRSQGQNISDINYLLWLKNNYPEDLELTIKYFPFCRHKLFDYECQKNRENSLQSI